MAGPAEGRVPAIHALHSGAKNPWMAVTSTAMTKKSKCPKLCAIALEKPA